YCPVEPRFCVRPHSDIGVQFRPIFAYIEMFYNSKRRHSFLDFISPNEFEKRYNDSVTQPKVLTE
ncbi:IS3 family transposase, partial [Aliarcobacter butzleri]|uniref:IS3 family transposase n=1 Tax=Aliarcobacter butzleri TaxID=28197 RepID=UPI001D00D339